MELSKLPVIVWRSVNTAGYVVCHNKVRLDTNFPCYFPVNFLNPS